MVDHLTVSVKTAGSRARIDTFLVRASFVLGTFGAHHALWSTTRGTTDIIGQTRTNSLLVNFTTLAVGTARAGLTRVLGFFQNS